MSETDLIKLWLYENFFDAKFAQQIISYFLRNSTMIVCRNFKISALHDDYCHPECVLSGHSAFFFLFSVHQFLSFGELTLILFGLMHYSSADMVVHTTRSYLPHVNLTYSKIFCQNPCVTDRKGEGRCRWH